MSIQKEENCMNNHEKCYSLSNIYYGTLIKLFPFKQIYNLSSEISYRKENKYCEKMNEKYGDYAAECRYLRKYLDAFTRYMDDHHLNKSEKFMLFMHNPCTTMEADSVEELYTNFKIFVDGYCIQNGDNNK